jgi:hypothetical protein
VFRGTPVGEQTVGLGAPSPRPPASGVCPVACRVFCWLATTSRLWWAAGLASLQTRWLLGRPSPTRRHARSRRDSRCRVPRNRLWSRHPLGHHPPVMITETGTPRSICERHAQYASARSRSWRSWRLPRTRTRVDPPRDAPMVSGGWAAQRDHKQSRRHPTERARRRRAYPRAGDGRPRNHEIQQSARPSHPRPRGATTNRQNTRIASECPRRQDSAGRRERRAKPDIS